VTLSLDALTCVRDVRDVIWLVFKSLFIILCIQCSIILLVIYLFICLLFDYLCHIEVSLIYFRVIMLLQMVTKWCVDVKKYFFSFCLEQVIQSIMTLVL
jgi:hypothetical protein